MHCTPHSPFERWCEKATNPINSWGNTEMTTWENASLVVKSMSLPFLGLLPASESRRRTVVDARKMRKRQLPIIAAIRALLYWFAPLEVLTRQPSEG